MRYANLGISLLAVVFATLSVNGDTLALRDGKTMTGTLLGATVRQVEFLPASGKPLKVLVETVASLKFSEPPVIAGPPLTAKTKARPPVVLPAGTAFHVRTIDPIEVDVTQAGARFRGAIDHPIMSGGDVIVSRGAGVTLVATKMQQSGR